MRAESQGCVPLPGISGEGRRAGEKVCVVFTTLSTPVITSPQLHKSTSECSAREGCYTDDLTSQLIYTIKGN